MIDWMRTDPIAFFTFMLYRVPAVLLALILHEMAHGYVAYLCGDTTARDQGRLSPNPLHHLSLVGTVLMFLAGVGWAKPVPINPNNFRRPRRDDFLVSIAGVTVNFCLFLLATLLSILVNERLWQPELFQLGAPLITRVDFLSFNGTNFSGMLFSSNEIISEITGNFYRYYDVSDFLRAPWLLHVQRFLYQLSMCNLGMCLFNLLPFPPLDGFHVMNDILLRGKLQLSRRAFQTSMLVLFAVMMATNVFSNLLSSAIYFVQGSVLQGFLALFHLS